MPKSAPKPCAYPGCPNYAAKKGYCGKCYKKTTKARYKRLDERIGTSTERGYGVNHRKLRKMIFAEQPLCNIEQCFNSSQELDHINGDTWDLRRENLQGLCRKHHNMKTMGSLNIIEFFPSDIPKPNIPVKVVCGCPGSGKTTYVKNHAKENDIIIDVDVITSQITGEPLYSSSREWLEPAIKHRNNILRNLHKEKNKTAWLITTAASYRHRRYWGDILNAEIIVLETPPEICIQRLRNDDRRTKSVDVMISVVNKWWSNYIADASDKVIRG